MKCSNGFLKAAIRLSEFMTYSSIDIDRKTFYLIHVPHMGTLEVSDKYSQVSVQFGGVMNRNNSMEIVNRSVTKTLRLFQYVSPAIKTAQTIR